MSVLAIHDGQLTRFTATEAVWVSSAAGSTRARPSGIAPVPQLPPQTPNRLSPLPGPPLTSCAVAFFSEPSAPSSSSLTRPRA